jgi:hypothetical protein
MPEVTKGLESARVLKYSEEQVTQARERLGFEPEGRHLAEIHPVPAGDSNDQDRE